MALKNISHFFLSLTIICSVNLFAQTQDAPSHAKKGKNSTTIQYYQPDDVTNSIPYFDHRFRIDADLNEITMIFYHRTGAKPVILVRPDGSKIRVNNYDKEKIEWYDDRTYDMIKIKKPMPGPWQAIGQILDNSEILVVSDVKIVVPPLPKIMLSGETIKVTGKLVNGDEPIKNRMFNNVVELDVEFISTNNSAYDNFGAENIALTKFRDDGRDLDEYKNDGVFTGEFDLNIPAGEWIPVYKVEMPMAKRELKQKPVMVQKNPITISVDITKKEQEFHTVHFHINDEFVEPNSIIFQGKITYPNKQSEPFSIMDGEGLVTDKNGNNMPLERIKKFGYTEHGVHRINVSVFGKTKSGREFRLVVPEFTFNVELSKDELLAHVSDVNSMVETKTAEQIKQEADEKLRAEQAKLAAEQAAIQRRNWIIIGAINGAALIIGLIVIIIVKLKRKKARQN